MARLASILVLDLSMVLSAREASKPSVRVGILYAQSSTLAKSESSLVNAGLKDILL